MAFITAAEATALVAVSEATVTWWLDKVSIAITQAATDGKRELKPVQDISGGADVFDIKKEPFRPAKLTPFQERIKKEINMHGYHVAIKERTYTPSGFGMMDEDPQPVTEYNFTITW
jgi:hypothetical protein